ncbi:hypothetical protein ACOMHN_033531 [Nucella lapillus]
MPEAALVFRVRCVSFHHVYLMAKKARWKVAMRINVITLRARLTGVMAGLVLSVFFYSDIILRCGDVELNPGPTKPGSSLRQGWLKSFSLSVAQVRTKLHPLTVSQQLRTLPTATQRIFHCRIL